mgnify:FL=1
MENKKKKRYGIIAALLLLVLAAGVGTYAWLTATQSLENVFTVGSFGPTDKKPDPTDPEKPGTEVNDGKAYLFETKWVKNSKIVPGATTDKNPNVGIKKGSDDAFVFIYVKNAIVKTGAENALNKTPYFTLNTTNWKPVEDAAVGAKTNGNEGQYVSGLFMYAKSATSGPAVLGAKAAIEDVYTGELFSQVMIPGAMTSEDVVSGQDGAGKKIEPKIVVSAYIFGADQKGNETDAAANALKQAKEWAKTQAQA